MAIFYFLASFLLVRRINKSLKFSILQLKWKSLINVATWSIIGLYIVVAASDFEYGFEYFAGSGILVALLYYIDKQPDFVSQRPYLIANLPLVAVGFINALVQLIAPVFFEKHDNISMLATIAAFAWIFGRWASNKKQEEELRISAERRSQLESLVQERTAELMNQKEELVSIVEELKSTQDQLIQSEKMASLGELTAGIAHEIQNPLNFVNNFSEVSMELIDEMGDELEKGDFEEVKAIAADIKQNLEKIRHHGQRADGIVKGMLQHSRASSNTKEPTDINKLADEYLRLAYHGLRAKDKSFNADLITHFAEQLPPVNIVPQDIGRVLLNLFNNAFYAVQKQQKVTGPEFKPAIELSTKLITRSAKAGGNLLEIMVKDNGTGIPDDIKDKIMQPFFTTKATGEGTGLGLSLSYDIVVKGHGGNITINSVEGKGSEFLIILPVG